MDVKTPFQKQPEKIIEGWIRAAKRSVYPPSEQLKVIKLLEYFHRQVRCHNDQRDRDDTLIYNWNELESLVANSTMWGELTGAELKYVLGVLGIDRRFNPGFGMSKLEAHEFFAELLKMLPRHPRIREKDLLICKNGLLYLQCEATRGRNSRDQRAIKETWLIVHRILKLSDILETYRFDKSLEQRVKAFVRG